MEVSLCMIVKDEEENLEKCLTQVSDIVSEIVIVDTGSSDRTKEIAKSFTDRVFDFEWIDDFSAARNFSFSKATKEYLMWLDADDIITEENRNRMASLFATLPHEYDGAYMVYECQENGVIINSYPRLRLVKASAGFRWIDRLHESLKKQSDEKPLLYTSDVVIKQVVKPKGMSVKYLDILERMVEENPDDLRTLFQYASELERHSRKQEAIGVFESFFEKGGYETADCLFACLQLGTLYGQSGQLEGALTLYRNCMSLCGDRAEFCCQLGNFYYEFSGDVSEAVFWYEAALNCKRPSGKAVLERFYYYVPHFRLYQIFEASGQKQIAEQHLLRAYEYMKLLES